MCLLLSSKFRPPLFVPDTGPTLADPFLLPRETAFLADRPEDLSLTGEILLAGRSHDSLATEHEGIEVLLASEADAGGRPRLRPFGRLVDLSQLLIANTPASHTTPCEFGRPRRLRAGGRVGDC